MNLKRRLHVIQHVSFEDLAYLGRWASENNFSVTTTQTFSGGSFPESSEFDWLVILGGPMNIYEEKQYPWLRAEKRLIERAIREQKTVLGICLGAQLMADVLGGPVTKNADKEIGWFPVSLTREARALPCFSGWPDEFMAFHWHGDTFAIPKGAVRIAESKGCANQAFQFGDRAIGLQFHVESLPESIERLINHCGSEMVAGPYIQRPDDIQSRHGLVKETNRLMEQLLARLLERDRRH